VSRIGRSPIPLPRGVEISATRTTVTVKGPKGQLVVPFNPRLKLNQGEGVLSVERPSDAPRDRAQHGLIRSLISNAVQGVTEGYSRNLQIQGVGYRCAMRGKNLELQLGFSHPVVFEPPEGITVAAPEPTASRCQGSTSSSSVRSPPHPRSSPARLVPRQRRPVRKASRSASSRQGRGPLRSPMNTLQTKERRRFRTRGGSSVRSPPSVYG
jgi:large subunit ribosomal protein L6